MALRTVGVRLAAEVSGYINSLRTAKNATKDFASELNKAAKKGDLDAVADSAGRMGLALSAGFAAVIAVGARFDKQMSSVQSATHATTLEMERLREAALQAGADTAFSATEAAQGIEELAKAGVDTSDILRGGLAGALDLAAAGQIEVGEAAETAASAMTQFRLSGAQVPHVADLLAAAAGKAQGGVREMGQALNQAGLVASQAGLSIEETTGTLAAFASAGLLGSDAGTSFKTMLQRLVAPTDEAARRMAELGIRAFDAQGRFVGMEQFAGSLEDALADLTDEQRNAALSTIFGADAIRAASVIYRQGEDGIREWIEAVDDQGFAAETAAAKTDNLLGDVERLTGSLETLAIESSTGASSGLRTVVQAADNLVQSLSQIPAPVQTAAVGIAGVAGAALLASAGAVKMRESVARAAEQLNALGPMGERTARGLNRVTAAAARVGVALAAAQVASAAFGSDLNPRVSAMADGMEEFARSGKLTGEAARVLGNDLARVHDALKMLDTGTWSDISRGIGGTIEGLTGLGGVMNDSMQKARERLSAMDQALTQLVAEGKSKEAEAAFERLAAEGSKFGISVEELKRGLPGYAAAVEEAAKAGDINARAQAEAAVQADILADGWDDAAKAADGLRAAHEQLTGSLLGSVDAEIAFEEAVDTATETIAKNGQATNKARTELDLNSAAGRDNAKALRELVDTTIDATQAKFDETKSVEEARKTYEQGRAELIRQATQAGLTEAAARQLADQWLKMPPLVQTKVNAPGLANVIYQIGQLGKGIAQLPAGVNVTARGTIGFNRHGGVWHAQSGLLRDAAVFSPRSPARFAFAEPATGGEAFVPKFGDRSRSLSILDVASRWHRASVVPNEQMGHFASGVVQRVVHEHRIVIEGTGVLQGLRKEIRVSGGNVQTALGT